MDSVLFCHQLAVKNLYDFSIGGEKFFLHILDHPAYSLLFHGLRFPYQVFCGRDSQDKVFSLGMKLTYHRFYFVLGWISIFKLLISVWHISTKFYSLIQSNIGLNIGNGLTFVKCELSFKQIEYFCVLIREIYFFNFQCMALHSSLTIYFFTNPLQYITDPITVNI